MDLVFKRVNGLELDKCMEIAHDLREWFNEQGLRKMVVDIREYETYGAYLNGELVGFAVLRFEHDFAEIMWMAIKRKYQGIGIGTKLLNFIEEVVKDHGTKLIIVKTSGDPDYKPYVRTRMFYEKHGFTPLLYVDSYPEWEEPMILYVKPLC
jgi:GNAT superfamily N-acetyltransferase